jgi:hypothetical protein
MKREKYQELCAKKAIEYIELNKKNSTENLFLEILSLFKKEVSIKFIDFLGISISLSLSSLAHQNNG